MDHSGDDDSSAEPPLHLVFMGVSGSGKTTAALAVRDLLDWEFAEADDFLPPDNVTAMVSGRALTDTERWGWSERMRDRTHFMPPELLASQLATLEPLQGDEDGMAVDMTLPPARIVAMVLDRLDPVIRRR